MSLKIKVYFPMKRLLLVYGLWLAAAAPAAAADYLTGDWFILTAGDSVSSSDPSGAVAKALAGQKDSKCLAFTAEGAWSYLFGGNGIIWSGVCPLP